MTYQRTRLMVAVFLKKTHNYVIYVKTKLKLWVKK